MANGSSSNNRRTTYTVNSTQPSTGPVQHDWEHPPPILGMFEPPPSRDAQTAPGAIPDPSGSGALQNQQNRLVLRDFPQVPQAAPDRPQLFGQQAETWFRLNRHFGYEDVNARVQEARWEGRQGGQQRNTVNMSRRRNGRDENRAVDWTSLRSRVDSRPPHIVVTVIARLTPVQIAHNTTWTVTAAGIHPPRRPNYLLPLDTFLENGQAHRPGPVALRVLAWIHADGDPANVPAEYATPPLLHQATAQQNRELAQNELQRRLATTIRRLDNHPGFNTPTPRPKPKPKQQADGDEEDQAKVDAVASEPNDDDEEPPRKKPKRADDADDLAEQPQLPGPTPGSGQPFEPQPPVPSFVPPSYRPEDDAEVGQNWPRPPEDQPEPARTRPAPRPQPSFRPAELQPASANEAAPPNNIPDPRAQQTGRQTRTSQRAGQDVQDTTVGTVTPARPSRRETAEQRARRLEEEQWFEEYRQSRYDLVADHQPLFDRVTARAGQPGWRFWDDTRGHGRYGPDPADPRDPNDPHGR